MYSNSNNIIGNVINSNIGGIDLYHSSNNSITDNIVTKNSVDGIGLTRSSNNSIVQNTVVDSRSIHLHWSNSNNITGNFVSGAIAGAGIYLDTSCDNNIVDNTVSDSEWFGIDLVSSSRRNTVRSNTFINNDNGIALHYSSNNNDIIGNIVRNSKSSGIILSDSSNNNNITGNTVRDNDYGIHTIYSSSNNKIYLNNFINNDKFNVYSSSSINFWNSTESMVYQYNCLTFTNYMGNYWDDYTGRDADDDGIGDTPYSIDSDKDNCPLMERFENYHIIPTENQPPIANFTYTPENPVVTETITFNASYSYDPDGSIEKYEWDFGDGNITNTTEPFINHFYALAQSYIVNLTVTDDEAAMNSTTKLIAVSEKLVFDTESSANPYPSIMGTHEGTIIPSSNINVSTLYTYPCAGTGGHTESIELYENCKLIANGSWNGYIGDYYNITIHNQTEEAPYVTLLRNHEYRYVIKTGSYPQIIHESCKNVTGGTITCDKFIDANGKIYTDWIPAIKLYDL